MIKSIAFWALLGTHTIIWASFGILLSLFTKNDEVIHFYVASPWSKIILWFANVQVNVTNLDNIDKNQACIYIPNHLSFFDIFSLLAYLPVNFKFILKEELMRLPVFGWAVKKAGYISIDRSSPSKARQTFKQAVKAIRSGRSLVIFAEGTRSKDGALQPLKKGAFQLAIASSSPIVPIAIKGSNDILKKGDFRVRSGVIHIQVGQPISTKGYNTKSTSDLIEAVTVSLRAMLEEKG